MTLFLREAEGNSHLMRVHGAGRSLQSVKLLSLFTRTLRQVKICTSKLVQAFLLHNQSPRLAHHTHLGGCYEGQDRCSEEFPRVSGLWSDEYCGRNSHSLRGRRGRPGDESGNLDYGPRIQGEG